MLVKRSGLGNENMGGREKFPAKIKSLSQVSRCTASSSLENPPSNDAQHECVLGPPAARVQPAGLDIKSIPRNTEFVVSNSPVVPLRYKHRVEWERLNSQRRLQVPVTNRSRIPRHFGPSWKSVPSKDASY